MRPALMLAICVAVMAGSASAVEYRCTVARKIDSERVYTAAHLERSNFSVLIEDHGNTAHISRCSFAALEQKVTCDRYEVDEIAVDEIAGIKKYYYYRGQLDVQLFRNLSFIENNGRGSISFGKCVVTAP